jgi:hypothetical protein
VLPEGSQLVRAIRITGLHQAVPTHGTIEEALAETR